MSARSVCHAALLVLILVSISATHADIYRWDNGALIPGTEGIEPGPGVQLDHMQLAWAGLSGGWDKQIDLTGANFEASNLTDAMLEFSNLTQADFSEADLTGASLADSTWIDAELANAVVTRTDLASTARQGLSKEQFYSTWNYQEKNLQGIGLSSNALIGWNFEAQDLSYADLAFTILTDVNLSGATIMGTRFLYYRPMPGGLTAEQLYSTVSYQEKNLQGIELLGFGMNLTGWDFRGQDLSGAWFSDELGSANLTDADLSGANLTGASLGGCRVTDANFTGALITNTWLPGYTADGLTGLTKDQFYSTASYQSTDLRGIGLYGFDLSAWDFSSQNLTGANLSSTTLTNANLTGANLKNAYLNSATDLASSVVDAETTYNQWTVFPEGFDPAAVGLTLVMSPVGDLDADDGWDVDDVDMLASKIGGRSIPISWLPEAAFDLNGDSSVNPEDHRVWVKEIAYTWYGDANLDGEFNSSDFVEVLQAGKYEKAWVNWWGKQVNSASWSEGDWNGDGVFDTGDLVKAMEDGGYEMGPREPMAVPEPGGAAIFVVGVCLLLLRRLDPG